MFLNASKPPFNNRDARRAVAYALDRGALAATLPGQVTCQLIPPDFPAYQPYCPFTLGSASDGHWTAPDSTAAHALVRKSGTRGAKVVLVELACTGCPSKDGKRVVATLSSLGYHATLKMSSDYFDLVADPKNEYNAGIAGWGADYPAASNYVATLASCNPKPGPYNYTGYCNRELDRQVVAAYSLQISDPGNANEAWAIIDREMVADAAIIPYGNDVRQVFVSRRVGNTLEHPILGPLIAQMWVQ